MLGGKKDFEKLTATDRVVERGRNGLRRIWMDVEKALPCLQKKCYFAISSLSPMTCEEGAHWEPEIDRGFEEE